VDPPALQDATGGRAAVLRLTTDPDAMKNLVRLFFLLTVAAITAAILRSMI
jgi:hypothetical protein